jgi:hypothetical protein
LSAITHYTVYDEGSILVCHHPLYSIWCWIIPVCHHPLYSIWCWIHPCLPSPTIQHMMLDHPCLPSSTIQHMMLDPSLSAITHAVQYMMLDPPCLPSPTIQHMMLDHPCLPSPTLYSIWCWIIPVCHHPLYSIWLCSFCTGIVVSYISFPTRVPPS